MCKSRGRSVNWHGFRFREIIEVLNKFDEFSGPITWDLRCNYRQTSFGMRHQYFSGRGSIQMHTISHTMYMLKGYFALDSGG